MHHNHIEQIEAKGNHERDKISYKFNCEHKQNDEIWLSSMHGKTQ